MIAVVVDSNSQMPPDLAARLGIDVVPLTVTVDGVDHLEGVDLDADTFYRAWDGGRSPTVTTSQPSPGQFVDVYRRAVVAGATEIISVHVAETMSGTLNSARLAAADAGVPVHLVDSGTASFGISCCAWAAVEEIRAGSSAAAAARTAERRGSTLYTSFVVGAPELADRSGRVDFDVSAAADDGVAILAMTGSDISVLDMVHDLDAAVAAMVTDAVAREPTSPGGLRLAVGTSDESSQPLARALTDGLRGHPAVFEVVEYRIGPSIGAHTGPGTAGLFVF
jgi:DegV family protein with EDD domain